MILMPQTMFDVEEQIRLSNELTEKRIRDNARYINENKDKWEEQYQKYKPYNYLDMSVDNQLYLERGNTKDVNDIEGLFKYLVCRAYPRSNVDYYLEQKYYNLIDHY